MPKVSQLDRIERQLETLTAIVTGNGTPEKGIIVRLDRIENWMQRVDQERSAVKHGVYEFVKPMLQTLVSGAIGAVAAVVAIHGLGLWK